MLNLSSPLYRKVMLKMKLSYILQAYPIDEMENCC